jgi:6-pyruvoyltetrahydropterin/6-carboxytetrahydropterin synthase
MYSVIVEDTFCATHSILLDDGSREPLHGHDWQVSVMVSAERLGASGMVVDFLDVQASLKSVMASLHHTCLDEHEWFRDLNPTTEVVARTIFDRLSSVASWGGQVTRVDVREAPGCLARYERV